MSAEYLSGFFWSLGALSAVGATILIMFLLIEGIEKWDNRRQE